MEIKKTLNNAAVSTTKFVFGGIHLAATSTVLLSQAAEAKIINRLDGEDKEHIMKQRSDKTFERIQSAIVMYEDLNSGIRSTFKRKAKAKEPKTANA